jgi:hypothetical protein
MCNLDFDGHCEVWDEWLVNKARKEHVCDSCGGGIAAGSSYVRHFSIYDGDANSEKQCLPCRTIADAFTREHRASVTPGSLLEFLDQCLDEERWGLDDDLDEHDEDDRRLARAPSRLSDSGLRWKYALVSMRARGQARRAARELGVIQLAPQTTTP